LSQSVWGAEAASVQALSMKNVARAIYRKLYVFLNGIARAKFWAISQVRRRIETHTLTLNEPTIAFGVSGLFFSMTTRLAARANFFMRLWDEWKVASIYSNAR
jgi:hypothetical protein